MESHLTVLGQTACIWLDGYNEHETKFIHCNTNDLKVFLKDRKLRFIKNQAKGNVKHYCFIIRSK